MVKIYHSPGTRGFRVIWACEELAVPYLIEPVDFSLEFRMRDDFLALSPAGKVPAMTDGDTVMAESGAMLQYLINKYDTVNLQPKINHPAYAQYLQWSWFAEATFTIPISEMIKHRRTFPNNVNEQVVKEFIKRAQFCADVLDRELTDQWIIGEQFTGADIMLGMTLSGYKKHVSNDLPKRVEAYYERLTQRPGFIRSTEVEAQSA